MNKTEYRVVLRKLYLHKSVWQTSICMSRLYDREHDWRYTHFWPSDEYIYHQESEQDYTRARKEKNTVNERSLK